MPQHVPETCNESDGSWLPLTEYSVKSGVSLSTIRRKIKSNNIRYRLEKGRYLILFNETNNAAARNHTPVSHTPEPRHREEPYQRHSMDPAPHVSHDDERWNSPLVENSVRMVSEAFEHALREKDERIRLLEKRNQDLEERLNELRLLVQVLEEKYEVRY